MSGHNSEYLDNVDGNVKIILPFVANHTHGTHDSGIKRNHTPQKIKYLKCVVTNAIAQGETLTMRVLLL